MAPDIACVSCRLWAPNGHVAESSGQRLGKCQAHAPKAFQKPDGKIQSVWPFTLESDRCGDHSPCAGA